MATLPAPQAARRPTTLAAHGDIRIDDWFWLRDRDSPEVLAYLEAENAYAHELLAPSRPLQELLFEELRSHVQEDDISEPVNWGNWVYSSRTIKGQEYAVHERAARTGDVTQIILDENVEAGGQEYFSVGDIAIDPQHNLMAYTTDFNGGELYNLSVRDLRSLKQLSDRIEGVYYSLAWSADSQFLFYTRTDDAMRPHQIWRHALGSAQADDVLIFQEDDERFDVGVGRSRSGEYIFVVASSRISSEVHYLRASQPTEALQRIAPREAGVEYHVDHHQGNFVVWTNANGCTNFEVYLAAIQPDSRSEWVRLIEHDPGVRIANVSSFADFLVLYERTNGLERLRIRRTDTGEIFTIDHPDPVYTTWPGSNREYETSTFRYVYSSLVCPRAAFDYDVNTHTRVLVKQQPVPNFDPALYVTRREWAPAADGTLVPISIVQHIHTPINGTAPLFLYGYGSYESSVDPSFTADILPLLDRGWMYAIAHPRGGGEMGRGWYEKGKLAHKMNTFTDFCACADHLIAHLYCDPQRIVARGASAGGLLMGAIANLRPELWRGIIAEVPFLDVVSTMSDPTIPLTVNEWEEWGNPDVESDYWTMLAYSPYDNIAAGSPYPRLHLTAGLNDPRVQYWEPAKYVAKMRELCPEAEVVLRTEMGAGHGGPSGRYEQWREEALLLAWAIAATDT